MNLATFFTALIGTKWRGLVSLALLIAFITTRTSVDALHGQSVASHTARPDTVDTLWYEPPFPLQVGDVPLDVADASQNGGAEGDDFGHAAPFLADVDGDGRPDLTVGTFSGRFRFYRNVGTSRNPKFTKDWTWLDGGGEIAQVTIYCCVASGPEVVDIDGDGIPDLTSGSYDPGAVYWWKGLGHGRFATRQLLTTVFGVPIFAHLDRMKAERWASFMSLIAWGDFSGSGRPDLVLGDMNGELFLIPNEGAMNSKAFVDHGYTALPSQPAFAEPDAWTEVTINGQKAIPDAEGHAAPAVADWDGDGRLDILVGTDAGSVYLFRNSGTTTKPVFNTRKLLIPPGNGVEQWVEPGTTARRGIRAQIQVVDYNGDGKPDILFGDWAYTETPRANLTAKDKQQVQRLRAQLATLDRDHGFTYLNWRHKYPGYIDDTVALHHAESLTRQIAPYLETIEAAPGQSRAPNDPWARLKGHGRVWVFLNSGKIRPVEVP